MVVAKQARHSVKVKLVDEECTIAFVVCDPLWIIVTVSDLYKKALSKFDILSDSFLVSREIELRRHHVDETARFDPQGPSVQDGSGRAGRHSQGIGHDSYGY